MQTAQGQLKQQKKTRKFPNWQQAMGGGRWAWQRGRCKWAWLGKIAMANSGKEKDQAKCTGTGSQIKTAHGKDATV